MISRFLHESGKFVLLMQGGKTMRFRVAQPHPDKTPQQQWDEGWDEDTLSEVVRLVAQAQAIGSIQPRYWSQT